MQRSIQSYFRAKGPVCPANDDAASDHHHHHIHLSHHNKDSVDNNDDTKSVNAPALKSTARDGKKRGPLSRSGSGSVSPPPPLQSQPQTQTQSTLAMDSKGHTTMSETSLPESSDRNNPTPRALGRMANCVVASTPSPGQPLTSAASSAASSATAGHHTVNDEENLSEEIIGDTNTDMLGTSDPGDKDDDITDYERVRRENIQRNEQFLLELGLGGMRAGGMTLLQSEGAAAPGLIAPPAAGNGKGSSRRRRPAPAPRELLPRRVQPRRGAKSSVVYGDGGEGSGTQDALKQEEDQDEEELEEEEIEYDDSSVLQYLLSAPAAASMPPSEKQEGERVDTPCSRLEPVRVVADKALRRVMLQSADLAAVYSMDFHASGLFVAGGKGGNVAIFAFPDQHHQQHQQQHKPPSDRDTFADTPMLPARATTEPLYLDEESDAAVYEPLLVFRAHQRWVSCTKFLCEREDSAGGGGTHQPIKLLTAADDGLVKLWDAGQISSQRGNGRQQAVTAKLLASSSCGHATGRGIFSLDEQGGHLVSGGKDRAVCLSRLSPSGASSICPLQAFTELHENVVKSVSWQRPAGGRDGHPLVFASGGQDRRMCVKDTRCGFGGGGGGPSLVVDEVHGGGVHTVAWCPHRGGEHWLLSAGYDGWVHLFDLRAASSSSLQAATTRPVFSFREHHAHTRKGGGGAKIKQRTTSTILTPCFLSSCRVLVPSQHSGALSMHCLLSGDTVSRGLLPGDAVPLAVTASCSATRLAGRRENSSFVVAASNRRGAMHVYCAAE